MLNQNGIFKQDNGSEDNNNTDREEKIRNKFKNKIPSHISDKLMNLILKEQ